MSFNPLWINTALKHIEDVHSTLCVSIPYGLTLLSNSPSCFCDNIIVSIPYGLTLLSNKLPMQVKQVLVSIPYGLTLLSN